MINKLASSISKLIGTIWFAETPIVKLVFDEATSAVNDSMSATLEKRKAERFFVECADEVLAKSSEFFKTEFSKVHSERSEVLLDDIAESFASFTLSREFLASDFSHEFIADQCLASLKSVDRNSAEEVLFCKSAINNIAFYICQYVHLSPNFVPKSVRQIVENQSEILSVLRVVLEKTSLDQSSNEDVEVVGNTYLTRVRSLVRYIQVFGISTHSIKKKYLLESSYISLSVNYGGEFDEFSTSVSAEEFLSDGDRFLIEGGAGSGKTTLLQWMALSCCEKMRHGIPDFYGRIPIFIRLRSIPSFTGVKLSFLDAANISNPNLFVGINDSWLSTKVGDGEAIFLIDGLDEVPISERDAACDWIDELCEFAHQCPVVLTTRPMSSAPEFLEHFKGAFLENLSIADIRKFVTYWHRAVGSGIVDETHLADLDASRERLLAALSSMASLRSLATNPLMCAVLCTVNLDRNCNIPREKSEIYASAIELLLGRRDQERRIELGNFGDVPPKSKRIILQEAARWLTINEKPELAKVKFDRIVRDELEDQVSEAGLDEIVSSFIERSGLIRDVSAESIDFIHKQFQEYFAAESFVQEDDIGLLESNIEKDNWREIFPLAASMMNKNQASQLISSIVKKSEVTGPAARELKLLAILCGEFAPSLRPDVREVLSDVQREIFPPQTVEEVYQLLPLGEKLTHLVTGLDDAQTSDRALSLCLKVLIESGSSDALKLIPSFVGKGGISVLRQILNGWAYFDSDQYGQTVIEKIDEPYEVNWQERTRVGGLVFARNATAIGLQGCNCGDDLRVLPEAAECKKLSISKDEYLRSLDGVSRLENLSHLQLIDCSDLIDISEISQIPNLRKLEIVRCQSLENLSGFKPLKRLLYLSLKGCLELSDIGEISALHSLEELNLDGCYGINDWSPLENLRSLRFVRSAETGWFTDMSDDFQSRVDID